MEGGARGTRPAGVAAMNGPLRIILTASVDVSLSDGAVPVRSQIREIASLSSAGDDVTSAMACPGPLCGPSSRDG